MKKLRSFEGKTREEKLNYLNSLKYDILLRQKKGLFYLIIPEIPLIASGKSLEEAYNDLNEQKQSLFNNILDNEDYEEIAFPRRKRKVQETLYQLKIFTYKLIIIIFLVGIVFAGTGIVIKSKVSKISGSNITRMVSMSIRQEMERLAGAPESAKEERRMKIRRFFESLQPLVDDFRDVFSVSEDEKTGFNNEMSNK